MSNELMMYVLDSVLWAVIWFIAGCLVGYLIRSEEKETHR